MKFGNLLKSSAEQDPELAEVFKFYKRLKKDLKRYPQGNNNDDANSEATTAAADSGGGASSPSKRPSPSSSEQQTSAAAAEEQFVAELQRDVDLFRQRCYSREEDAIIKLESLQQQATSALSSGDAAAQQAAYESLVNLHGELLLLLHWGMMVYTAMAKIIKKHLKQTGIGLENTSEMFRDPLCAIDVVTEMIRKTDSLVERLAVALGHAPAPQPPPAAASAAPDLDVRALCKAPTTESQAEAVVASAIDALAGGAAGALAHTPAEAAAVLGLIPTEGAGGAGGGDAQGAEGGRGSALGKRGREGQVVLEDGAGQHGTAGGTGGALETRASGGSGMDGDHLRRTHVALDMWRTLTSNAKTPTSFPPADEAQPVGSARGSNHH